MSTSSIYTRKEFLTGEIHVWARPRLYYDPSGPEPFVYELRGTDSCYAAGAVKVISHTVSLEVPAGINLVEKAVQTLHEKKEEALAAYLKTCEELNAQIDQLRLLSAPEPVGTQTLLEPEVEI